MLYNPKYDPKFIQEDLINHGVCMKQFEQRLKEINNGSVFNQYMYEFLYETIKINGYKIY